MDNPIVVIGITVLIMVGWGAVALKYEIWNRKQDKLRPVEESDAPENESSGKEPSQ